MSVLSAARRGTLFIASLLGAACGKVGGENANRSTTIDSGLSGAIGAPSSASSAIVSGAQAADAAMQSASNTPQANTPQAVFFPRVLSVAGPDAGILPGSPLLSGSPLHVSTASTVVLRDARNGLEYRLEGPFLAYAVPGRVSLVSGTFEALTAPAGAVEFWLPTPYGTVRYTGRVRVTLSAKEQRFEALAGQAYLFRPVTSESWTPLDKPLIDHGEFQKEEKLVAACKDASDKATKLANEIAGGSGVDTQKALAEMSQKKVAQASCETARIRLLQSERRDAPALYRSIDRLGEL